MSVVYRASALALALALAFSAASAGESTPAAAPDDKAGAAHLPQDLVLRLLRSAGGVGRGDLALTVGEIPERVASQMLLPDPAVPDVTLEGEEWTTVLVTIPGEVGKFMADHRAALVADGWELYVSKEKPGGFQLSPGEGESPLFCRDGSSLSLRLERDGDRVGLTLTQSFGRYRDACRYQGMYEHHFSTAKVPLPTLYPPEDATTTGGGGSSSSEDHTSTSQALRTELSVSDLLVHYAEQLEAQGWVPDAQVAYSSLAYQSWMLYESDEATWHGLVFVTASSRREQERTVELRVTRLPAH